MSNWNWCVFLLKELVSVGNSKLEILFGELSCFVDIRQTLMNYDGMSTNNPSRRDRAVNMH